MKTPILERYDEPAKAPIGIMHIGRSIRFIRYVNCWKRKIMSWKLVVYQIEFIVKDTTKQGGHVYELLRLRSTNIAKHIQVS